MSFLGLQAEAAAAEAEERPKYVATYIGSKQKLVDWIWRNTPEGVIAFAVASHQFVR